VKSISVFPLCTLFIAVLATDREFDVDQLNKVRIDLNRAYSTVMPWIHYSFNEAMKVNSYPQALAVTERLIGISGEAFIGLCRDLYSKNNPSNLLPQVHLKIPKIIHQIWIGGKLPEIFNPLIKTWIDKHIDRGWVYKLWTDEDIESFGLYNKGFYDQTDSPGVKSDLLKWEIVYRYGGVYIDTDFECYKALDILHYTYDFYTALQPLDTQFVQLGAALFAAVPGHPILQHCIETIKDDWHHKGAPTKSGPVHFTKSFYAMAGKKDNKDIAFPSFYFYPLGCLEKNIKKDEWLSQGAFAVHHWAKSWMPANYRPSHFRDLGNEQDVISWNT
jgi:mannosyltransferase OCH1-like enzyme